jgi:hypothetical protein
MRCVDSRYTKGFFLVKINAFVIVAVVVLGSSFAFAGGLPFNGNFEKLDKSGHIVGWKNYFVKNKPVSPCAESCRNGKYSLRIVPDGLDVRGKKRGGFISRKECPIKPEAAYSLSFWAKSPVKGQVLTVYYYTYSATKPHYYRKTPFTLTQDWRRYTFANTFPNAAEWKNRKLYVFFSLTSGEALVDEVSLQADPQNVPPYLKSSTLIEKDHVNLLENPGFELGWQGWHASSYRDRGHYYSGQDERQVAFDDTDYAHGGRSLKLPPFSNVVSKRQRFVPKRTYICSFYAKCDPGDKSGSAPRLTVDVVTPKWKRAILDLRQQGELTTRWKRYSFSFTTPEHGSPIWNSFYVRMNNYEHHVWVDSFKLEQGDLSEYDFPPQIGFAVPEQDAILRLGTVSKLEVRLQASEKMAEAMSLNLLATDVYGKVLWQQEKTLQFLKKGLTSFDVSLTNKERGVVEVKAALLAQSGREVSQGVWRYWVVDGRQTILNPLFGYENRVSVYPVWAAKKIEKIFSLMGAGYQRNFLWPEKYSPIDAADPKILTYLARKHALITDSGRRVNMTAVGYLYKDSLICHYNKKYGKEAFDLTSEDITREIDRWGEGFAKVLRATSKVITHYEIQNEINLHRIKKFESAPSDGHVIMTPEHYVTMLKKARETVSAVAPQAKIGLNLCRVDLSYLRQLTRAGALTYIDFFSFHSYQATPEKPPVYEQIAELKRFLKASGADIPIFNSEQYCGVRNYLNVSSEYDKLYFSDYEEDFTGRIIQNYLHHAAQGVPYSLFAFADTAFMLGISNPIYYYATVGAYRNVSQLLVGVIEGRDLELNEALRAFLFVRKDGKKIVSFNTKSYGKIGKVVRSKLWSEVLDINGNPLETNELNLQYLPCYAVYPANVSKEKAVADLKSLNFLGLSSPFKTEISLAENGEVRLTRTNVSGQPQSGKIVFKSLPENWGALAPIRSQNVLPGKTLVKSLGRLASDRDWRKSYVVTYGETYADGFDQKNRKLPSMAVDVLQNISVDAQLEDWGKARWLKLDRRHLSKDFSKGKAPRRDEQDLSAELALAWDRQQVYLALKVRDNVLAPMAKLSKLLYNQDSIQVYFDLKNDDTDPIFKAYDYNDMFYTVGFFGGGQQPVAFLEKNPAGRYVGAANQTKGVDSDVKVAYRQTADGYVYEMAFPESALPFLKLESGSEFGFDILINDNDGDGRKQGVTFGSVGGEPHRSSFTWKALQLR